MFQKTFVGAWATCALMLTHPAVAASNDIVLYASDASQLRGNWRLAADPAAADGQALVSMNHRWSASAALAVPSDTFDLMFDAPAGTVYHLWIRMRAANNSTANDSVYVQYSDAVTVAGAPIHRIGTRQALTVELEDCRRCKVSSWGWQDDTWSLTQVTDVQFATSGRHTLRVQTREDGVSIDQFLLSPAGARTSAPGAPRNDMTILAKLTKPAATPYLGVLTALPGTVNPAGFDEGGAGLAYHDGSPGNAGNAFRTTDVDLEPSALGGYNVGWTADGEWLGYWVTVGQTGAYILTVNLATPLTGPALHVTIGNVTATIPVPATGGWQAWSKVSVPISLTAGVQRLFVVFDVGGVNLGPLTFARATTSSPPPPPPPTGSIPGRPVGPTDDLQAAIDAAAPGDTLLLAAGATYVGNFVLPVKNGTAYVTIRSNTDDAWLPAPGTRVTPAAAPLLAKIRSPNSMAALTTAPGAHHYRLQLLEFQANVGGYGDIVSLGDGSSAQNTIASVPYELVIDRCYLHGDPAVGQKRGLGLNSASTTVMHSHFADFKARGMDSQAIAGWNGPGPFTLVNNSLEAAGENVMFGGADPSIPGLVPSDITIRGNHFSRPLAWRTQGWDVKNLFELKNAQRVVVDGNLFENHWAQAQAGYAIVFTPRNQDGTAPWSVVQQVRFTNNVVRHVSSGINLLGRDNIYPSELTSDIVIRNNLFEDVSGAAFGGAGRFMLINGGARITVDHNTVLQDGWTSLYADGSPVADFAFTNNIVPDYSWAVMGGDSSPGNPTIGRYFPNGVFLGSVFAGSNPWTYPSGNYYPAALGDVGFVDLAGGHYRLSSNSPYRHGATDGSDVGTDIDVLNAATHAAY